MKWKTCLCLSLMMILVSIVDAPAQLTWETLPLQNEISPNYTKDISFDHMHYMWISTARGLYRIDGNEARYYVHNPEDTLSLINNNVTQVYEDDDQDIWILSDKGVQQYIHKTETFHTILKDYIVSNQEDFYKYGFECAKQVDEKHVLFGTKDGCVLYNKNTQSYQYIPILEFTNSTGYSSLAHVIEIVANPKDSLQYFLLTRSGIYSYNVESKNVKVVFNSIEIDFASIGTPGKSMVYYRDVLYFIVRTEVFTYNIKTGKHDRIGIRDLDKSNFVLRDIILSQEGKLIISTANNGIYQAELEPPYLPALLAQGHYNQLAIDPAGRLVTIANTKSLVLSNEIFGAPYNSLPPLTIDKFWLNGNRQLLRDVFADSIYRLRDFERNLAVKVSLNQYDVNADVSYFYQLDNGLWKPLDSGRKLNLKDLSLGDHRILFKANYHDQEMFSKVLQLHIDRFFYEQWWFRLLVLSTVFFFLASIYYLINSLRRNRSQYKKQVIEMELNALRSQMNPHFIFNTLNSIKNYVLTKTPDDAAYYLTKFSQLIRSILENSKVPFLTLQQEMDSIKLYIEMEHLRFGGKFEYEIYVDEKINLIDFKIAPMLVQPFIENAIWHGLMNVKYDRHLFIRFESVEGGVVCTVEDNGIGLSKSKEIQAKRNHHKKSLGLDITLERIKNINLLYNIDAKVEIKDRSPKGTIATIYLPKLDR